MLIGQGLSTGSEIQQKLRGFCTFYKTMLEGEGCTFYSVAFFPVRRMSQLVKANFRPKLDFLSQFLKILKLGLNIIIVGGQRMYFRILFSYHFSLSVLQTWDI